MNAYLQKHFFVDFINVIELFLPLQRGEWSFKFSCYKHYVENLSIPVL